MLFYTNQICQYSKKWKEGAGRLSTEYTENYQIWLRDDKEKFRIIKTTSQIDIDLSDAGSNLGNYNKKEELTYLEVKDQRAKNLLQEIITSTILDESYSDLRKIYQELYDERIIFNPDANIDPYYEVASEDESEDESQNDLEHESEDELVFGSDDASDSEIIREARDNFTHIKPCDDNGNIVFGDFVQGDTSDAASAPPSASHSEVSGELASYLDELAAAASASEGVSAQTQVVAEISEEGDARSKIEIDNNYFGDTARDVQGDLHDDEWTIV